jgi:hypothetical protein
MAAPVRSTVSRFGRPSVASIRNLSNARPAKAQVQLATVRESNAPLTTSDDGQLDHYIRRGALSRTYFDATGVRWVAAGDDGPKDPNKAKLGKSTSLRKYTELHSNTMLIHYSFASSPGKIANPSFTSSPPRYPCAKHRPPSLPLDASSPTNRVWPSRLQCRSLDITASLEPSSNPRQCLHRGSRRAHDDRAPHVPAPPRWSYTRATCCPLV